MSLDVATHLEHNATKNMYERLIKERDKSRKHNAIIKDIEGSYMFQDAFCCVDPIYKQQIEFINENMPDKITEDTVGSYLHGCFQAGTPTEIACTPACLSGLKNPDLPSCEIASYGKVLNGELNKLNDVTSDDAYVFMSNGQVLTEGDMVILWEHGVKIITLYHQNGDSINYSIGESFNVANLSQGQITQETTTTNSWTWLWILFAIFIVILLVIIFTRS